MEVFGKAKTIRLCSRHDKYLLAEDDEESVYQDRNSSCKNAIWTVEILENAGVLRLKSCYGKYLSASNMPYFLGVSGKKVVQSLPARLDSSLEWEPIREGIRVKLKTRFGHYLRANGGVPPWRNSITHDIPHRSSTQDWVLWDVDIVEFQKQCQEPASPKPLARTATPSPGRSPGRAQPSPSPPQEHVRAKPQPSPKKHFRAQAPPPPSPQSNRQKSPPSPKEHFRAQQLQPHLMEITPSSPPQQPPPHYKTKTPPPLDVRATKVNSVEKSPSKIPSPKLFSLKSPGNKVKNTLHSPVNEGRLIVYEVVDDDDGIVVEESKGELSFTFKGSEVEQLKQMVKKVTGLTDIIVCSRNPLNGKPYPLRLHLPPNNATVHLVVVPSTSKLARDLK